MNKLTSMQLFTKVAKAKSFSAVTNEMGVSRAMATKHIAQLEQSLGIQLLFRTTRQVRLTENGKVYFDRCLRILDDIEQTESTVTQLQTHPRGTLKIASPPFFGAHHLAPVFPDYLKRYPDVSFSLLLKGGEVDLIDEGLDLAIRFDVLSDSNLIARRVGSSRMVVCGAPAYLERFGVPKKPEQLQQHNCLVNCGLPPGDNWKFILNNKPTTVRVSGNFKANIPDAARLAAVNGMGLTMLPTYMIYNDVKSGQLQILLSEFEAPFLPIWAVYPHRQYLTAKVRTFVDFLCEQLDPAPWGNATTGS